MAQSKKLSNSIVQHTGITLLNTPLLNKDTAFTLDERLHNNLLGLLPPDIETLPTQIERAYEAFQHKDNDLERHIYLRALQDTNEVLFYSLILEHLPEMMPLIYTPVVGLACQQFSEIYRHPRGLFISYPERDNIDIILDNTPVPQVEVIVVTDGERILGLGDQGAGGMGIPIGKLSLYTACGGINPKNTLPIFLDVGTNNQKRLNDPTYIGWRHERITGDAYFDFIDQFIQAVKRKFPQVLLQFEDFAQTHAAPLLTRYRDQLCTFNDDIQGTAAVTLATILAATHVTGRNITEQTVVMFGAGSAGCGIAEQIKTAMMKAGLTEMQARSRFYMIDRYGLLHDKMTDLLLFQTPWVQPHAKVTHWSSANNEISLLDVIKHAHPTILIGVSGQANTFTETVIKEMVHHTKRPIIFPLSNPTSKVEGLPSDIINWTQGQALIATGSPFCPVKYQGKIYPIAQCNNSYIFPAMGLGILSIGARRVSDNMFMAAAEELSQHAPMLTDSNGALLPPLENICDISKHIAYAIARAALTDGLADGVASDIKKRIDTKFWHPHYIPLSNIKKNKPI